MRKYLIVGPSWIGDMIMANALFRLLKFQHPDCVIDVLAPGWSHAVLARMSEVRKPIVMPVGHGVFNLKMRYRIGRSLREEGYDQAILLPNTFKSALIPWFARIPLRTGWRGEWRYGLLNDLRLLDKKRYPLMVQRYLALGVEMGGGKKIDAPSFEPHLQVDFEARKIALEKYQLSADKPLLILCPGAQYGNSKRWPEKYFAEVAKYYIRKNWQVGVLGGKNENELVDKINQILPQPAIDLTNTTLLEAIDLLSLAKVVVSNDSGLMHVACALGRKVIAIYGSSSPDFTPPLNHQAVVFSKTLSCKPCFKRECPLGHLDCLKMILPEEIIQEIGE